LITVTERAELAGGWCRVHSGPGEGAILECRMPLGAPTEHDADST
jgi:signal transduction histidine kinase